MFGLNQNDELTSNRDTVLVVRLVLDRQARLQHGELLDADAVGQGRFVTLSGLVDVVRRWMEMQRQPPPADPTPWSALAPANQSPHPYGVAGEPGDCLGEAGQAKDAKDAKDAKIAKATG